MWNSNINWPSSLQDQEEYVHELFMQYAAVENGHEISTLLLYIWVMQNHGKLKNSIAIPE